MLRLLKRLFSGVASDISEVARDINEVARDVALKSAHRREDGAYVMNKDVLANPKEIKHLVLIVYSTGRDIKASTDAVAQRKAIDAFSGRNVRVDANAIAHAEGVFTEVHRNVEDSEVIELCGGIDISLRSPSVIIQRGKDYEGRQDYFLCTIIDNRRNETILLTADIQFLS